MRAFAWWGLLPGLALAAFLALPLSAQVHPARLAGKWYPADPGELRVQLGKLFEAAAQRAGDVPPRRGLRGLIVPHAAIGYSGLAAASAYRLVGRPRNVIVLAFSHRRRTEGVTAPGVGAYATPLGRIPVASAVLEELGFPRFEADPIGDHSLEIQLPFVRYRAPDAALVPLYVGEMSGEEMLAAARKLAVRVRAGDLLIASSDFTHYGKEYRYTPFPADEEAPEKLASLAQAAFESIGSLDVSLFDEHLAETGDTICGRQPIRLLMSTLALLEEDTYPRIADFMTSGGLTRDYSMSVSYGALAFYAASGFQVGAADRQRLLASARATLDQYLASGTPLAIPVPPDARNSVLAQRSGAFVTVRKARQLRGCVGEIVSSKPIFELVADRTLAAAAADARFEALTSEDGPVQLEVSLLTPVKRIRNWRQFRAGYGAVLVLDGKGAVLLPQVAAEYGWNASQFLEAISKKAGLPADGYRDPAAALYVFLAQVFAEPAAVNGAPAPER